MTPRSTLRRLLPGAALVLATTLFGFGLATAREEEDEEAGYGYSFSGDVGLRAPMARPGAMKMRMGATPGGAQDIDFARSRILAGEVPHPSTFTPEGLFSQHDLPLGLKRKCAAILCLSGAATKVDLIAQPEARWLAQLEFASNLDPRTWKRPPLNLVAVVDKSGSMHGAPLETVKASLRQVASQMTKDDQLTIVLYGDRSHVHLSPTGASDRERILASIDAIQSAGSTAMEAGLRLGYDVARRTQPGFSGTTRVMLFTDERPNVGATDAASFMGLSRAASRQKIGTTTVGVGVQFGAELATAISSVRGGNLFFFPDVEDMKQRFERDFDTLVTELAYDLRLRVEPAPGTRLVGLYGLPGDLVKRTKTGGLSMTLETVFLSRDKGGIYFAFAPEGGGALPRQPGPIATAQVSYLDTAGKRRQDELAFAEWTKGPLPLGLARGRLLVDEVTTLKKATALHLQSNDQEGAYRLVRALRARFEQSTVPGLAKELTLVKKLDETLTHLSGHRGEASPGRDAVTGMPAGPQAEVGRVAAE